MIAGAFVTHGQSTSVYLSWQTAVPALACQDAGMLSAGPPKPPPAYLCPLTGELMTDPVRLVSTGLSLVYLCRQGLMVHAGLLVLSHTNSMLLLDRLKSCPQDMMLIGVGFPNVTGFF